MNFEELLRRWNKGILVGAQTAFAKKMGVNQSTVARWVSGNSQPDERLAPKVAVELGVSVEYLLSALSGGVVREKGPVYGGVSAETFPPDLREKIRTEAQRRMLTFEMAVVVLLGEHFAEKATRQAGGKSGKHGKPASVTGRADPHPRTGQGEGEREPKKGHG